MKKQTLTTIARLKVNDVFSTSIDCCDEWKIICCNKFFANLKFYGAQAVALPGKNKERSFRKNQQVVYLKRMKE